MSDIPKDDGEAAVKPRVIDLEAEEVTEERPGSASEDPVPPPPPPPPRARPARRGRLGWIVAALVIGALAGGWLYRDLLSSYLPSDQMKTLQARLANLEAESQALNQQLGSVAGATDAVKQQAGELSGAIADAAAKAKAAEESASALDTRLVSAETAVTAAQADLASLRAALSASGPSTGTPDTAALAALAQRIEVLEKDMASLKTTPGGGEDTAAATALSQSLSDLKAKIAAGAAYAEELDRIARMVPAASGLEVLTAHAAEGLPNAKGLAAELRSAIPLLPKPADPPTQDGGYWDSIWQALTSVVTIRNIGETDWASLAEKCAAFADSGDLAQAISLIDATEGTKPIPLSQWRDRAGQRLNLEAALEQASDAILRQIAALGGGQ